MARRAARLDLRTAQQRVLPVMHLAVGLIDAVNRYALAIMTRRAAELFRRVGIVGKQHLASRMGFEGVLLFLEASSIDRHMARLTAIHARNRLIETIAVELLQGYLLDLGNLVEGEGSDFKGGIFHHPNPFIAFRREFA